jgi:type IV secretion system protein VirB8
MEASAEDYFAEASSWDADRLANLEQSRRLAWRVAACGWLAVTASALALAMMMPLKRVETVIVRVDNSTGIVDVVPSASAVSGVDEAVTRYLIGHYVTVCERFNRATAESDFEECSAFHGTRRNEAWYALWQTGNAASPLNIHRDGSEVRSQVQSISFFRGANGLTDIAQVRYVKWLKSGPESPAVATHWFATVHYDYAAPSENIRRRSWNPLGFRINDFSAEPEIAGESVAGGSGGGSQ